MLKAEHSGSLFRNVLGVRAGVSLRYPVGDTQMAMSGMPLSEFAARKAKPSEKAYKLTDGGGLFLHVQPSGSKLWRLKYRFDDKGKLLSFGPYPLTTIAEARAKRDDAKKLLAAGRDPPVQKMLDRIVAATTRVLSYPARPNN